MDDFPPTRLRSRLDPDERSAAELDRLTRLMGLFVELPPPPDPFDLFPRYAELRERFLASSEADDGEVIEETFLELYCHLHGHEAPYTAEERRRVDEVGGYWCHAGGLSPILKCGPHIDASTVSADFGAGNGLQGLLMQKLDPHRLTVQVEISSRMVEAGRELQRWLDIPAKRVRWVVGDVFDVSPAGMDFVYLYRPVKPVGAGRRFYEKFAAELAAAERSVVIFSIADCLREFLPAEFETFYSDGHLTCFRRTPESAAMR